MSTVLVVFLVGVGSLCAGEVTGGGKIAAGAGWLSGSDWTNALASFGADNAVRINFSVGPYFDFSLSESFSIQAEILYSSLGGAYTYYDAMVGDVDGRFYGGGIEILLFAKPKFHLNTGYIYVLAGPEVFFILGDLTQKKRQAGLRWRSALNRIILFCWVLPEGLDMVTPSARETSPPSSGIPGHSRKYLRMTTPGSTG